MYTNCCWNLENKPTLGSQKQHHNGETKADKDSTPTNSNPIKIAPNDQKTIYTSAHKTANIRQNRLTGVV